MKTPETHPDQKIAAVVIGRNEEIRLRQGLADLTRQVDRVVYVDSGSTDDSVKTARDLGAEVVLLPTDKPFTAARARNAGLNLLTDGDIIPTFIQFIDGDCELQATWIETARQFLETHPDIAVVCGRRRERFPDASIYNAMIDREWDTPIGKARSCGGDALMRTVALQETGGYNPNLIAGEEPELCVRLRQKNWGIWRLDAEMTLHDAALTHFNQWWNRARRAGHAYAEGAAIHGARPERHNVAQTRRAVLWGLALPLVTLIGILVTPWALLLLLVWPAQILRLSRKGLPPIHAAFLTFGKIPEAFGVLTYLWRRLTRQRSRLIEYK